MPWKSLGETGIFLGGFTIGVTLLSITILCSPGRQPMPWNRYWYSVNKSWSIMFTGTVGPLWIRFSE